MLHAEVLIEYVEVHWSIYCGADIIIHQESYGDTLCVASADDLTS